MYNIEDGSMISFQKCYPWLIVLLFNKQGLCNIVIPRDKLTLLRTPAKTWNKTIIFNIDQKQ